MLLFDTFTCFARRQLKAFTANIYIREYMQNSNHCKSLYGMICILEIRPYKLFSTLVYKSKLRRSGPVSTISSNICIYLDGKMASSTALSNHCEVLGNFSIGEDKKYRNDLSQRLFLVEPDDDQPNFDLLQGLREYKDTVYTGPVPTSMSPLLDWFHDHRDELIKKKVLKSEGSSRK